MTSLPLTPCSLNSFFHILGSTKIWFSALLLWFVILFILSSFSQPLPDNAPSIPFLDKILHFGYFLGGGIILTTWMLLKSKKTKVPASHYLVPILFFALIGLLDEYHQTFTPGRSGNDGFDWVAYITGATVGTLLVNLFRQPLSSFLKIKLH